LEPTLQLFDNPTTTRFKHSRTVELGVVFGTVVLESADRGFFFERQVDFIESVDQTFFTKRIDFERVFFPVGTDLLERGLTLEGLVSEGWRE